MPAPSTDLRVPLCYECDLERDVPPPRVYSLPLFDGRVCLVVDGKERLHAMVDECPPLRLPISRTGVVDTPIGVIEDTLFGTRFRLADGGVRGRFCPGGEAGPLARLARRTVWLIGLLGSLRLAYRPLNSPHPQEQMSPSPETSESRVSTPRRRSLQQWRRLWRQEWRRQWEGEEARLVVLSVEMAEDGQIWLQLSSTARKALGAFPEEILDADTTAADNGHRD